MYDVFPAESLAVTGAFIKVVKVNRLNSLLAYAPSELTPAQDAAKTSWESTVASILESLLVRRHASSRSILTSQFC